MNDIMHETVKGDNIGNIIQLVILAGVGILFLATFLAAAVDFFIILFRRKK